MDKQNLFDLIKQIPLAEENTSVVERLESLKSTEIARIKSNHLVFNYFWCFPDGRIRSQITVDWFPEDQLVNIYAHSVRDPEFYVQLAFCPGACNCIYSECDLRKWPSNSQEFWERIQFILDAEEGQPVRF